MEQSSEDAPNSLANVAALEAAFSLEPTTVKLPPATTTPAEPPPSSKPKPPPVNQQARSSSWLSNRDEGLLHDVLLELDRERSRRAELEAQVRILEEEVHRYRNLRKEEQQKKASSSSPNSAMRSPRDYNALEAEKIGYLELLQALTSDRPSFRAASAAPKATSHTSITKPTLPLHAVRLLEIMPWDERCKPHLFGQEEVSLEFAWMCCFLIFLLIQHLRCLSFWPRLVVQVYEWQMLSAQKRWQHDLKYFPTVFKTLPIVVPQPGNTVQETAQSSSSLEVFLSGFAGAPPRQCTLTDLGVTRILNIDKGYPLPRDGGQWQWIGGWRIEKSMETDEHGWSYSNEAHLPSSASKSTFTPDLRLPEPGKPNCVKRRRKWTRCRVLVDYPHSSTSTQEYLKLVSQRATLMVSVEKLSEQLVDTKVKLTGLEEDHLALREQATRAISHMGKESIKDKEQLQILLESFNQREAGSEKNGGALQPSEASAAQPGSTAAKTTVNLTRQLGDRVKQQQVLGWTKDHGNQLLEKFKQSGASDWTKDQGNQLLEKLKQQTSGGVTQGVVDKWKSWPRKNFQKQDSNAATSPTHSLHGVVSKNGTAMETAQPKDSELRS